MTKQDAIAGGLIIGILVATALFIRDVFYDHHNAEISLEYYSTAAEYAAYNEETYELANRLIDNDGKLTYPEFYEIERLYQFVKQRDTKKLLAGKQSDE